MSDNKKKGMNIPNTLSLIRVCMVPVFIATVMFMNTGSAWDRVVPAVVFALTALTDMLDGKIARKYNLITDFGKFIDPLADKFMVFGGFCVMLVRYSYIGDLLVWVAALVMFRELAVTSIRLVVSGTSGKVIAAAWSGKIKAATQMVATVAIIIEPVIIPALFAEGLYIISYIAMAAITVTTVWSGIDYMRAYLPLIDTNK